LRIETKAASQLSDSERARTDCVVTSSLYAYQIGTKWASADWTVMVWEDHDMVSNVHIIERNATVVGQPVRLGGIGNVATKVEWRKRGYASAALRVAREFLFDPLKVDFGLMMCFERLVPYYEKLGWQLVAQSVLMDQPDGKRTLNFPVMVLPVVKTDWPQGEIDLCGLPW
jgi:predicted acetyltransferase